MAEAPRILLEHHLKRLKLPTFLREYEKLARQCAAEGLDHVQSRFIAAPAAEKGALAHGIGRTKGGRNTKLHAVCDAKGRPLVLLLTPGNVHDCKVAQRCIEAMPPAAELVADKGYDSKALRDWLAER